MCAPPPCHVAPALAPSQVYVLSPRHCAGKPVYRQRGPEGLFLHSPAHENQWNVGPDLCDNSPRNKCARARSAVAPTPTSPSYPTDRLLACANSVPATCHGRYRWMELYSTASGASEILAATWFEYTDEAGWTKNAGVTVKQCSAQVRPEK